MKIGIFGGTFDPIHQGHLIMASIIYDEMGFDKIVFIPSGNPPHKTNKKITDEKIRSEMVRKAIESDDRFELSMIEQGKENLKYTYHTMTEIMENKPENEYYFIIGGDSLRNIETWYEYKRLLKEVKFVVVDRVSKERDDILDLVKRYQKISKEIKYIDMPLIEISSTDIRNRVKSKKSIDYMLPDEVIEIIYDKGLYDESN
ncbi:MAG: nicotinate-nucleotide adenylyltransferase [Tissierellia bacterium]|nr:nicotinate-nucleotide adenylyltransferase [Tissierellia bacterium]